MKNTIKYFTVAALTSVGIACTNLDEKLPGQYTAQADVTNVGYGISFTESPPARPADGLQTAYNQLLSGIATNGGFFAVQEGGTDEAVITQKGGDWYDGGLYIRIHRHEFSSQTWAINDVWNQAYNGIFQCNDLMNGKNIIANITPSQTAQLRFLRAFFHWRLMEVFGNVKIITTAGVDAPQKSRAEVYAFIENEVLAVLPDLPTGKVYGRATQMAAHAFLSRFYLNAGVYTGTTQYQKAINEADAVISSGLYNLGANYANVFSYDNSMNADAAAEIIWTIPFNEATDQGATWHCETLHYPSQLTYNFTDQPWNGFSTLEDFYNAYSDDDKRKAANFIVGQQYASDGTTPLLDLAFTKGYPNGANLNYTPKINELEPNAWRAGGARFGKFKFKMGARTNDDNDFPLFRYGEVLLNKAEAMQRLSGTWTDDGGARSLVNQIRTRAGTTPFASMTEVDMLAERGRELFIEAIRRTDMIRFGTYTTASWWEHTPGALDGSGYTKLMAIPNEQLNAGQTYQLTQNPGY
ncbi:MAG TPA: RagB/SusD family nutrient uptake outer membrane protein [Cyclobacteriaceae bacterium]|jgi:hypothetical protein|nr:RagB/SusD family nutrient uptake outer membrane protein [Cyclobacteriaceae bacterium]